MVQESYLRAYRGLKRFRGDAQFTTWMYRITANCASTHLGRRARHRHDELDRRRRRRRHEPDVDPAGPGRRRRHRATASPPRSREPAAPSCGPSSCCATSTTCPTRRSPPSSGSPSRRPRCGCTGPGASCGRTLFPCGVSRGVRTRRPCGVTRWPTLLSDVADGAARARPPGSASRRALPALPGRAGAVPQAAAGPARAADRGARAGARAARRDPGRRSRRRASAGRCASMLRGRRVAYVGGIAAADRRRRGGRDRPRPPGRRRRMPPRRLSRLSGDTGRSSTASAWATSPARRGRIAVRPRSEHEPPRGQ